MGFFRDLQKIVDEVRPIAVRLNPVHMVTPVNYLEEKRRGIERTKAGHFENPVFQYEFETEPELSPLKLGYANRFYEAICSLSPLKEEIKNLPKKDRARACLRWRAVERLVSDSLLTIEMARGMMQQDDRITRDAVLKKYGFPDEDIISRARRAAHHPKPEKVKPQISDRDIKTLKWMKFTAPEIAEIFTDAMRAYDPKRTWPVVIDRRCSAIDVRDKNCGGVPEIIIPEDRTVNGLKLLELVGHEIGCHWRDSVNAEAFLKVPKSDNEFYYEGHAKLSDVEVWKKYGGELKLPEPYYILAMELARTGKTFAEVLDHMVIGHELPAEKAWNVTYRVFRGISDPSDNAHGYAFTKDQAYFSGYLAADAIKNSNYRHYLDLSVLPPDLLDQAMEDEIDFTPLLPQTDIVDYIFRKLI